MASKKYGPKKDFEPDVREYVEEGNPSEITEAAWVVAAYRGKMQKPKAIQTGKWLFFVDEKYVDNTWENVKKAVEEGKLWTRAKVSTAWRSKGKPYVICVYTYDHDDKEDVMKIRDYLRVMGFKRIVSYKTDESTLAGIYSDNTEGIAKYRA